MVIRLLIVSDMHHGFNTGNKLGAQALKLAGKVVKAAHQYKVDAIGDLGDRITTAYVRRGRKCASPEKEQEKIDRLRECDRARMKEITAKFNGLSMPRLQVQGNHDACLLGDKPSYVHVLKDIAVIGWNPNVHAEKDGYTASAGDLAWLEQALEDADRPCIVFSHIPFDNDTHDTAQALKIDKDRLMSYFTNAEDIRRIVNRSGKVLQVYSGHRHVDRVKIVDGIPYLTFNSLVQSKGKRADGTRSTKAIGAYSLVTLFNDRSKVHTFGYREKSFTIPHPPLPGLEKRDSSSLIPA
jgi:Icc protein